MQHQFLINNKVLRAKSLEFFNSLDYGDRLYLAVVTFSGVEYAVLYLEDCNVCIKKARRLSRKFQISLVIKEISRDTDNSLCFRDITLIHCPWRKGRKRSKECRKIANENKNFFLSTLQTGIAETNSQSHSQDEITDIVVGGDIKNDGNKNQKKKLSLSEIFI